MFYLLLGVLDFDNLLEENSMNIKALSSNKFIFCLVALLAVCSIVFQNLPSNIYVNMLDLSFGFSGLDVQNSFEALGEEGRMQYIYSSLILDTVFPILYVLFFISILLKLHENSGLALFLPILAGIFDLSENISISMMMSFNSFSEIPESQILYASLFNQCKWSLCLCVLIFIFYRLILITLKRGV